MIEEYCRNDDEREITMQYPTNALQREPDLVLMPQAPANIFP
jgi:hypothetical protein